MEQSEFLNQLPCPGFLVDKGIIIKANSLAQQRGIAEGEPLSKYLLTGKDEYEDFSGGKLGLSLQLPGCSCNAWVSGWEDMHLFSLETEYALPELKAFALAAMQLKEPLGTAINEAKLLLPQLKKSKAVTQELSKLTKSLNQLLRAVGNMSDAAVYKAGQSLRKEYRDGMALIRELLEKVAEMCHNSGNILKCEVANNAAYLPVDAPKLERAILNLISNALKYSEPNSQLFAKAWATENRLFFSLENTCSTVPQDLFNRYLREPGLDLGKNGIGLGMSIVHSVATAHGGTVLLQKPENNKLQFILTLSLSHDDIPLRSPIMLPFDYTDGLDQVLLELSDVLPASYYLE